MNFQPVLDEIDAEIRPLLGAEGQVASYIPALARVPAAQFGIALRTCDGQEAAPATATTPFSIQSISKLFTLTLAHAAPGRARCGSASAASPRATRSTRWCSSRANRASRATPSSMPAPSRWPTGW